MIRRIVKNTLFAFALTAFMTAIGVVVIIVLKPVNATIWCNVLWKTVEIFSLCFVFAAVLFSAIGLFK